MNLELLEKQLYKLVNNNDLSLYETLRSYDIQLTITCNLSCTVLGFVYYSRLGNYHLIINGDYITQRKTFVHEIKHIVNDMPKVGYIIGLDMERTTFEMEADRIAETIISYK
jgi:hypothetical protein